MVVKLLKIRLCKSFPFYKTNMVTSYKNLYKKLGKNERYDKMNDDICIKRDEIMKCDHMNNCENCDV